MMRSIIWISICIGDDGVGGLHAKYLFGRGEKHQVMALMLI
jgi:hypothetical protein